MRLLRVQVTEFRALKDVDISFEPDFTPQVFPLGSLNGGGKSTLLQLIFLLLSRLGNVNDVYLKNIVSELKVDDDLIHDFIKINLLIGKEKVCLEYFHGNNNKMYECRLSKKPSDSYLCFHSNNSDESYDLMGFINVENVEMNLDNFLSNFKENITSKIFLISPSNQPYIFLSREERRVLFTIKDKTIYDESVNNIKKILSNFFTFDFVDVLVEVFRRARANDFKERNKDNPFAHTEKLEADINNLFIDGKKITSLIIEQQRHTQDEIQGVFFTLPSGQDVYPEDLSHGELKRLAIFVLIKYHEMQDAIVLIDEIENGFHPDWQYQIVRDLVEWGKNNQYILATHSYELCNAVTPAHVKELEPRLTKETL